MIKHVTTLVLGAGASMPYGFPSGRSLVQKILQPDYLNQKHPDEPDSLFSSGDWNAYRRELGQSGELSIDRFLANHPSFESIGKYSIAQVLSRYEDNGRLMRIYDVSDTTFPSGQPFFEQRWYDYLYERKVFAKTTRQISENLSKLKIITFNYDRSLEQFFWNKFITGQNLSESEAKALMGSLEIIHVHGLIGKLEYHDNKFAPDLVKQEYSGCIEPRQLMQMSKGIRIIHETALDNCAEFCSAKKLIRQSDRIYFLGFGYHQDNLSRLGFIPEDFKKLMLEKKRAVGGTFVGWSEAEVQHFKNDYRGFAHSITDCLSFLRNSKSFLYEDENAFEH